MRKPFKSGQGISAEPETVSGVLVFKHPKRLVAMCQGGIFYHWEITAAKQPALNAMQEGDQVFVNYDSITGAVYSIVKQA